MSGRRPRPGARAYGVGFRARGGCAGGEEVGVEECFVVVELHMRVLEHVARAEKM